MNDLRQFFGSVGAKVMETVRDVLPLKSEPHTYEQIERLVASPKNRCNATRRARGCGQNLRSAPSMVLLLWGGKCVMC